MVAAQNDDLAAAAAIGMHTAFVVRPHEHGPSQDQDLEATGPWDFICNDIVELGRLAGSASCSLWAKARLSGDRVVPGRARCLGSIPAQPKGPKKISSWEHGRESGRARGVKEW